MRAISSFALLVCTVAVTFAAPAKNAGTKKGDLIPLATKEEILVVARTSLSDAVEAFKRATAGLDVALEGTSAADPVATVIRRAEARAVAIVAVATLQSANAEIDQLIVILTQAIRDLEALALEASAQVVSIVDNAGLDVGPIEAIGNLLVEDVRDAVIPLLTILVESNTGNIFL